MDSYKKRTQQLISALLYRIAHCLLLITLRVSLLSRIQQSLVESSPPVARMAKTVASSTASASAMIVGAFIVLALCAVATAPVAMAQSCTTNGNSPTQGDTNACVQYVRNLGSSQCCQISSSGCTQMYGVGSAAVDICGPQGSCTSCSNAGNSLNTILSNCVANVGGTARVSGSIGSGSFTFQIRHT